MSTPLTLLTGFLGSGKTTFLQRLLRDPAMADTAVVINELGETGLDHLLVDHVAEHLRVLQSGCLCCTVRGDLAETLADLAARRAAGEIAFNRVVIETTGLADPVPVLHTLVAEPAVAASFRFAGVVTTVDAFHGADTLERHAEARRQAAMADVLLLTKTDLTTPARLAELRAELSSLNPVAVQLQALDERLAPTAVLSAAQAAMTSPAKPPLPDGVFQRGPRYRGHAHGIEAHCFAFDGPVDAEALAHWLDLLAAMRGDQLLRFKGLVHAAAHPDEPLVLHGAQHVIHPPQRLASWPSQDRRTRLIFITLDIPRSELERTLRKFAGLALSA